MALQRTLRSLFTLLLWSALFSVAYTQSPLYTSNQNTYFLHGFACADVGYLRQDWLATTRDATPLFSALVCATLRWVRLEGFFYLYYALILGIYFISSYKLAQQEVDLRPRSRKLAFLALFVLIHSAGWRFVISRALGVDWTYAFEGGLADQRLLGAVFQPSVFGVFLLAAVWLASQRKMGLAITSLAIAVWFHSTYLLPAILLFCGILAHILAEKYQTNGHRLTCRDILAFLRLSFFFFILLSPSFFYALTFAFGISPKIAEQGQMILFEVRIPHHANPTVWFNLSSLFRICLMVGALILTRQKALRRLLGIAMLLSALLTLLVLFTHSTSLALLFPWRVTTVLMPLSITILLSRLVELLPSETEQPNRALLTWIIPSLSTGLIAVAISVGLVRISLDLQRQRSQPERPLMEFVAKNKRPQDIYLIPVKMQDFRLATGAPIFVDFKSTPYHPIEVLEWYRRYRIADEFYQSPSCAQVPALVQEGISHLVIPHKSAITCATLQILYSDNNYQLIQIRP